MMPNKDDSQALERIANALEQLVRPKYSNLHLHYLAWQGVLEKRIEELGKLVESHRSRTESVENQLQKIKSERVNELMSKCVVPYTHLPIHTFT